MATRASAVLATSGIVVLLSFIASVVTLATADFHTDRRGFGYGAVSATAWLVLSWTVVAILFAAFRRRATTTRFRVTLLLNGIVAILLASDFYLHR